MQSIIRSINNCKKLTNKSNLLIVRNYTSNNNVNGSDKVKSFEEFKRERDLLKKKTQLVEKLTQLRIAGGSNSSEKVLELSKEIKEIESQLDPSLVNFVVQSKEQKEKDLELWKSFIEKKGIKTKSELRNINRFEFERFKNTGFLDNQVEQDEKIIEQENLKRVYSEAKKMDAEDSLVIRDPFKVNLSRTSIIKSTKEQISEVFKKFEESIKENEQFKQLALDFVDPTIPLSDKLIFKNDNQQPLKDTDIEEFTEEEYKQFKKDLKALYQFENSDKQTLETNLRNMRLLQAQLGQYIDEKGNIDIKSFLEEPLILENTFPNYNHPNPELFTRHTVTHPEGLVALSKDRLLKDIFQYEYPTNLEDEKFLKKLLAIEQNQDDDLSSELSEDGFGEDEGEIEEGEGEGEGEGENAGFPFNNIEDPVELIDSIDHDNPQEIDGERPFHCEVDLAEDEKPEFNEIPVPITPELDDEETISEDINQLSPEEIMHKQFVADGHAKDRETLINQSMETPEYTSSWALDNITKKLKEDLEQERIDKLEEDDPTLVRNFIKYKVDLEKEKAKRNAEEESRKYTMALEALEKEVFDSNIITPPKQGTVYNKNTGKIHIPKKKHSNCLLCKDPNWELDPLNVPFLTLYVTSEGDLLPRAFSGNCLKHQKKIAKTFRHAKALGLFNYKNGEFGVEDPNVYSLSTNEMEEYRKWYMGDYSKEEWEEVIDEFGELDADDEDEFDEDFDEEEEEGEDKSKLQQLQTQEKDTSLLDELRAEYGVEAKEMINYGADKNKNK